MHFSPLIEKLIAALRCLPGVGPKSAQRMALQLLLRGRDNGKYLAFCLQEAMEKVSHCQSCRVFSEKLLCDICASPHRDNTLLCIVENPIDVTALEQTGSYKGKYFVLLGHLSPLDGIGPEEIGIIQLDTLLKQREIKEIIIATNPTIEGEATAHYLAEFAKPYTRVTRIARGVSIGSDLEYTDAHTLCHALFGRELL